jgi:hypothetical protein
MSGPSALGCLKHYVIFCPTPKTVPHSMKSGSSQITGKKSPFSCQRPTPG